MDIYADLQTLTDKYIGKTLYFIHEDTLFIEKGVVKRIDISSPISEFDSNFTLRCNNIGLIAGSFINEGRAFFEYSKAKEKLLELIEKRKNKVLSDKIEEEK